MSLFKNKLALSLHSALVCPQCLRCVEICVMVVVTEVGTILQLVMNNWSLQIVSFSLNNIKIRSG